MIITDIDKLLDKIESILVEVGQSDPQFKLGDWITYKPHEVRKILEQHKDELEEEQGEIMTLPESAKGFMYLNEEGDIVTEHEKISEEDELKNALRFLKEYCDNHVNCKGCYIASRKYPYEACPCATLVNEVYEDDK